MDRAHSTLAFATLAFACRTPGDPSSAVGDLGSEPDSPDAIGSASDCDPSRIEVVGSTDVGLGPVLDVAAGAGGTLTAMGEWGAITWGGVGTAIPAVNESRPFAIYGYLSAVALGGGVQAFGDTYGSVHVEEAASGADVGSWNASPGDAEVEAMAVGPTGDRIAWSGTVFAGDIQVRDLAREEQTGPLSTSLWNVHSLAWTTRDALVTAGDWYGIPLVEFRDGASPDGIVGDWWGWDLTDGDFPSGGTVRAVAASPDGRRVVAAGGALWEQEGVPAGFVTVLEPASYSYDWTDLRYEALAGLHPVAAAFDSSGEWFALAGSEGTVQVRSAGGDLLAQIDTGLPLTSLGTTGDLLVAGSADGSLVALGCGT